MKREARRDEMRAHYDFTGGVRGKYARRYAEGSNVVVLDPDVARVFPNRDSVNRTLRAVAQIVEMQRGAPSNKGAAAARGRSAPRRSATRAED